MSCWELAVDEDFVPLKKCTKYTRKMLWAGNLWTGNFDGKSLQTCLEEFSFFKVWENVECRNQVDGCKSTGAP